MQCNEAELPEHIKSIIQDIKLHIYSRPPVDAEVGDVNELGEQDV